MKEPEEKRQQGASRHVEQRKCLETQITNCTVVYVHITVSVQDYTAHAGHFINRRFVMSHTEVCK